LFNVGGVHNCTSRLIHYACGIVQTHSPTLHVSSLWLCANTVKLHACPGKVLLITYGVQQYLRTWYGVVRAYIVCEHTPKRVQTIRRALLYTTSYIYTVIFPGGDMCVILWFLQERYCNIRPYMHKTPNMYSI
jgi:hypothetical protein